MIYKDPFANKDTLEGRWFAWYPVQLQGENKTAWLCYVNREWLSGGDGGVYIYNRIKT